MVVLYVTLMLRGVDGRSSIRRSVPPRVPPEVETNTRAPPSLGEVPTDVSGPFSAFGDLVYVHLGTGRPHVDPNVSDTRSSWTLRPSDSFHVHLCVNGVSDFSLLFPQVDPVIRH